MPGSTPTVGWPLSPPFFFRHFFFSIGGPSSVAGDVSRSRTSFAEHLAPGLPSLGDVFLFVNGDRRRNTFVM